MFIILSLHKIKGLINESKVLTNFS